MTAPGLLRMLGGVLIAPCLLFLLVVVGMNLFAYARYASGHPVHAAYELPAEFFTQAKQMKTTLEGGASPISVTIFTGTHRDEAISVLTRRAFEPGQTTQPVIRQDRFDAVAHSATGVNAPAFDAVTSIPGYYLVKVFIGLALLLAGGFVLLWSFDRHHALLALLHDEKSPV